ncbi:DUF4199 domain-containing protein [Algoriphagus sp. Y33]|uniref:DUF4199 domain-containing protein n=1 Tax=Algoriphagus sp. Y33 TaxID=2772483 RepID=UPI00177B0369|nr:DUF4199 domain-containing protein [Algoriphagus sp. Y33]
MENSAPISETVKKWGLIYGLIGIIYTYITAMLGLQGNSSSIASGIISFLLTVGIAFTIYFLATKEYRTENSGLLAFGKAFVICLLVGLLGGVLRSVGFYLYMKFIDPTYVDSIIEAQMQAQEQMGGTAPDPDSLPAFMKFMQTPEFFAVSTFISAIFGAIILGLIVAAINQKKEDFSY